MRLIDADELLEHLYCGVDYDRVVSDGIEKTSENIYAYKCGWNEAIKSIVENAPTVDAVPLEDYKSMESTVNKLTQALANSEKHGHWTDNGHIGRRRWCSVCGGIAFEEYDDYGLAEVTETDYCPHCGAKMNEVEDE